MKLPLYIVLFLFGLAITQSIYFYPLMPEIVGSHFDIAGKVNGNSPKLSYFIAYFVSLAVTSSFSLVLPLFLQSLPISLINLPHREYWLSGDQREASLQFLKIHFSWFGVATMLLMVAVFHITFLANLNPSIKLDSLLFWLLLGVFLVFTICWTVVLVRRFPKPL
jgi:uncharacterized membrane protein